MLIRHAEKPGDGESGVDLRGHRDALSLSVRGWQRAGGLVRLFAPLGPHAPAHPIGRPLRIVAARPSGEHPSTRPGDTVRPLADALGLGVEERGEPPSQLAAELSRTTAPVLVCWRHEELPALALALLQADDVPAVWPADRYDVVWVVDMAPGGWRFVQRPQRLLAGDRPQGIARRVRGHGAQAG